jgi:hypothetical protein
MDITIFVLVERQSTLGGDLSFMDGTTLAFFVGGFLPEAIVYPNDYPPAFRFTLTYTQEGQHRIIHAIEEGK